MHIIHKVYLEARHGRVMLASKDTQKPKTSHLADLTAIVK